MRRVLQLLIGLFITMQNVPAQNPDSSDPSYANVYDELRSEMFTRRDADWRNGALVYQVIVDRFAPAADLDAKRELYPAPKRLREWDEVPKGGTYNEEAEVWSHEIDFWGGDLDSLRSKLSYVQDLGVDVLYLNPIHLAYTNHKYDAQDYFKVSPEYGTREDVIELANDVHDRGMKLVLDGVFNHMGRTSPWFKDALANPESEWRDWYLISDEYEIGYRAWVNVPNLPELNLENEKVRARLWGDPDSVILGYLRDGVDGWRLDVAFDIGFNYLQELTESAHRWDPESLIIGEIWNYPEEWFPSIDGIMNMTARTILLEMIKGNVNPSLAAIHFDRMYEDIDYESLLKSWIILDNHDTPRLNHSLPEQWQQRMAQVLQFTLPGSPCIYYGVELGMTGGEDPEQRGPMRWDLVTDDNEQLEWTKKLIAMRNECRSLRIGEFLHLNSEHLMAFMRTTDYVEDLAIVVANPSDEEATDLLMIRDSKIMSYTRFVDQLSGDAFDCMAGTLTIKVPARTVYVLRPSISKGSEYTPYKRVQ